MYKMRCKMICHNVSEPTGPEDNKLCKVDFGPVYAPANEAEKNENAVYGKFTPSGAIWLNIAEEVAKNLKVGQAYYVDFSEAS